MKRPFWISNKRTKEGLSLALSFFDECNPQTRQITEASHHYSIEGDFGCYLLTFVIVELSFGFYVPFDKQGAMTLISQLYGVN